MKIKNVEVLGRMTDEFYQILTPEALRFIAKLEREFSQRREDLLRRRLRVQQDINDGRLPDFLAETAAVRKSNWKAASIPDEILDRRVEITGPVDRKMVINALNSGANVFMADFEDSHSPTWNATIQGQMNLYDAVRRRISFKSSEGKQYKLNEKIAVLFVRPRGWHLIEKHVFVDGKPVSASLFDFGLFFFHNVKEQLARGTRPYFYLPKLESHLEARLWNDVFILAQDELHVPRGTIRATVLIENILAAFEMDEIIYELRSHSAGLNCGRWDYIFSFIKKFRDRPEFVVPDRSQVTMDKAFLKAYSELLIKVCHRRGVHAMGGMAAQIPIKDDSKANAVAFEKVIKDKQREVSAGYDGTWVAHPGLVSVAREAFDAKMKKPNQLHILRDDVKVSAEDLLRIPEGTITDEGIRTNIRVGVQYLEAWLSGRGSVPLYNLMEDAATAEISRAQLWQWVKHGKLTVENFRKILDEELRFIRSQIGEAEYRKGRFELAANIFDEITVDPQFVDFLTIRAYDYLDGEVTTPRDVEVRKVTEAWRNEKRWRGIRRTYTAEDVHRLRGSIRIEHTLAKRGAERLWDLLQSEEYVPALGALTGNQAIEQVQAGLKVIYLSGWQVAADANTAGQMYPDQSLYPADSVPAVARSINRALQRADQIQHSDGSSGPYWFAPIVADAEAGFGGTINAFELTKALIEAGCAAIHLEDQLAAAKKCGHMGGKVLIPTAEAIQKLTAARLAADTMGVPTLIIARTDANGAHLLTSDVDPRDKEFLTGERTVEGYYRIRGGLSAAIARGLAYAPYADMLWCETAKPDLKEARLFAKAIHAQFPEKLLAYNCSPSFNWLKKLDREGIASFQKELASMGYKFQFVTLAGFHTLNFSMFELARSYRLEGMTAYSRFQEQEFTAEKQGYRAVAHQRFVGTGYFDDVAQTIAGGELSTLSLKGSTEEDQFKHEGREPKEKIPA